MVGGVYLAKVKQDVSPPRALADGPLKPSKLTVTHSLFSDKKVALEVHGA